MKVIPARYVADDGTEFDADWKCIDYENAMLKSRYNNNIIMWDSNKHITDNWATCIYVYIKDAENTKEYLDMLYDLEGSIHPFMNCPTKDGMYYYDMYENEWCRFEDIKEIYDIVMSLPDVGKYLDE